MQVVINHLTRMHAPRICIAGIDRKTRHHVRPTTPPTDLITRALLRDEGGPVGIGALVDLGAVVPVPSPPESEDHRFRTTHARLVRDVDPDEYLQLLEDVCEPSIEEAFGAELERRGWKYAAERGRETGSLAVVKASRPIRLEIGGYGTLTARLNDPDPPAFLSVTDLRFVEADHKTIREDVVRATNDRLRRGVDAFLMLGLARAFRAGGDDRERHWLQVNGLCLVDRPLGAQP